MIQNTCEYICIMCKYFFIMDTLGPAILISLKSPWRLTTSHKAFVVSGTCVHFGCRGDQSPSGQQSKQWEPQTAVSSLLGLISVGYPLITWTAFPFILTIHHKITLVVSGKHRQLMETVTSLMAEGAS